MSIDFCYKEKKNEKKKLISSSSSSSSVINDSSFVEDFSSISISKEQKDLSDKYKDSISIVNKILFPTPFSSYSILKNESSNRLSINHNFKSSRLLIPIDQYDNVAPIYYHKYTSSSGVASKFVTIYFHGNGEDLGDCKIKASWISNNLKSDVYFIEYPGYGLCNISSSSSSSSSSSTNLKKREQQQFSTEFTVMERARFCIEYVVQVMKRKINEIVLFGYSIGSAVASQIFCEYNNRYLDSLGNSNDDSDQFAGLILQSAFSSFKSVAKEVSSLSVFLMERFNTLDCLSKLSASYRNRNINRHNNNQITPPPIFFFHGKKDDVIPYSHTESLFNAWYRSSSSSSSSSISNNKIIDDSGNHVIFSKKIMLSFLSHVSEQINAYIISSSVLPSIKNEHIPSDESIINDLTNLISSSSPSIKPIIMNNMSTSDTIKSDTNSIYDKKTVSIAGHCKISNEKINKTSVNDRIKMYVEFIRNIGLSSAISDRKIRIKLKEDDYIEIYNTIRNYFNITSGDIGIIYELSTKTRNKLEDFISKSKIDDKFCRKFFKHLDILERQCIIKRDRRNNEHIRKIKFDQTIWIREKDDSDSDYDDDYDDNIMKLFSQYMSNKK